MQTSFFCKFCSFSFFFSPACDVHKREYLSFCKNDRMIEPMYVLLGDVFFIVAHNQGWNIHASHLSNRVVGIYICRYISQPAPQLVPIHNTNHHAAGHLSIYLSLYICIYNIIYIYIYIYIYIKKKK